MVSGELLVVIEEGKDGFGVIQKGLVGESNDPESHLPQPCLTPLVLQRLRRLPMHSTIQLDDQLLFIAVEVYDVVADLMLAAELQPRKLPVAEDMPENLLSRSLLLP